MITIPDIVLILFFTLGIWMSVIALFIVIKKKEPLCIKIPLCGILSLGIFMGIYVITDIIKGLI